MWIILIILLVIAAIVYFSWIKPKKIQNEEQLREELHHLKEYLSHGGESIWGWTKNKTKLGKIELENIAIKNRIKQRLFEIGEITYSKYINENIIVENEQIQNLLAQIENLNHELEDNKTKIDELHKQ